jgi:Protein of unknown function (DUF3187)
VQSINKELISKNASANLFVAMKKPWVIVLYFFILSFFSSEAYAFEGPLLIKNQFPLFITVNAPYLETASIENSFFASLSHSSIYLVEDSSKWSIGFDMEITELTIGFRKNIKDFFELGVDLPLLSFNSGFMDNFIDSVHETFDLRDYGRSNRPTNEFLYEVRRKGIPIIKGESGRIGIGDVRVTFKKPILMGDPAISIKGALELPTGDAKKGYGSGSVDGGAAVLFDKKLSENFKAYCNLGVVFPGDLKGYETVKLRTFVYGATGIEAALWKDFSLLGQLFVQRSPLQKTAIPSIDRIAVLLSLGVRYHSGNSSLELSLTEDPNTSGAPDFTLNFSFKRRF